MHVKIHLISLIVGLQQSFQSLLFIQPFCPKVISHSQTSFSPSSLKTGGTSCQNVWIMRLSEVSKQWWGVLETPASKNGFPYVMKLSFVLDFPHTLCDLARCSYAGKFNDQYRRFSSHRTNQNYFL